MAVLDISQLDVRFDTPDGQIHAVRGVNLTIEAGECLGVVGESGSGKSQSFLAAMGLLARNGTAKGSVKLDGQEILNLPVGQLNALRGQSMTMIFQDPLTALTPHLRIGEQMAEVLSVHAGINGRAARSRSLEWLDKVRMPDAARRLGQFPHELSGGQRQRVMIAMAMLMQPRLLIADEPTTALDVTVQAEILDLMADLQRSENTAIALITHDMGVVARMCDRIEVMRHGSYVESGKADDIFYHPQHTYTRTLLDAMPRLDTPIAPPTRQTAPPIMTAKGIKVHFPIRLSGGLFGRRGVVRAVDGVDLEIRAGETLGLVGESGCGKSTLARALLQLIPPTDGQVTWMGKTLTNRRAAELKSCRQDLQIVFQDPVASLDPRMTIAASVAEPLLTHEPDLSPDARRGKVRDMLERVGLDHAMQNRYPHELSGGQNQRVGIARAMITRPKMIVCDEAVSALDVSVQAQILELLKDLRSEFDMSMIFISHDLSVVREVADRIMVLYLGRPVEIAPRDKIFEHAQHPYTQSLISAVPVPDPRAERSRTRLKLPGELPSVMTQGSQLRFLPSRAEQLEYEPALLEVSPGHWVAEHDPIETILAPEKFS